MAYQLAPYKPIIRRLYQIEDKQLPEIASHMQARYGLKNTPHSYDHALRKWGFKKNVKGKDWKDVNMKTISRKRRNKATAVYHNGRLVDKKKLAKESSRNTLTFSEQYGSAPSPKTPEGFAVCTPLAHDHSVIFINNLPTVQLYNNLLPLFKTGVEIGWPHHASGAANSLSVLEINSAALDSPSSLLPSPISNQSVALESQRGIISIFEKAGCIQVCAPVAHDTALCLDLPELISRTLYAAVNNMIRHDEAEHILLPFLVRGGRRILENFLLTGLPVVKSLVRTLLSIAISTGNLEMVDLLVKESGRDLNRPLNADGMLPLHDAVWERQTAVVQVLLQNGANPNPDILFSDFAVLPLSLAAELGSVEIVKLLIQHGADVHQSEELPDGTALYRAAAENHSSVVEVLLEARADADPKFENGQDRNYALDALEIAAYNGSKEAFRLLLRYQGERLSKDEKVSLLIRAAEGGLLDTDTFRLILQLGVDVNASTSDRPHYTALQAAAANDRLDVIKLLLDAGADVNTERDSDSGPTVLQAVAVCGDLQLMQLLLQRGAYVNAAPCPYEGLTALQNAVLEGSLDAVLLLLENGADINAPPAPTRGLTALQAAAIKGNFQLAKILLERGADLNAAPSIIGGYTALQAAAKGGCPKLAGLILKYGVDVNADDMFGGNTALKVAASDGNLDMVYLLLDAGADINASSPDQSVRTALQAATSAFRHSRILVELFLNRGADANAPGRGFFCYTALQRAIARDDIASVRLLWKHGAEVNTPSKNRFGATLRAISCNSSKKGAIVRLLLEIGLRADQLQLEDLDSLQWVPISWEAFNNLLDAGLDVNHHLPHSGRMQDRRLYDYKYSRPTLLQMAAGHGRIELVSSLLQRGADVNGPCSDSAGRTALQAAAGAGNTTIVRMLLDAGAYVNDEPCSIRGVTALQAAAIHGHIETVLLLLERQADPNAPGAETEGRTALEGACEHGRLDIAQVLLNVGADVVGTRAIELADEELHEGVVDLLQNHCTRSSN